MLQFLAAAPEPQNVQVGFNFADINWYSATLIMLVLIFLLNLRRKNFNPFIVALGLMVGAIVLISIINQEMPVRGFSFTKAGPITFNFSGASISWFVYDVVLLLLYLWIGNRSRKIEITDEDHKYLAKTEGRDFFAPAGVIVLVAAVWGLILYFSR